MSPKQWLALCCFYISYLFFGASVFHHIEHTTELENRAVQLQERISINELLVKYASPKDKETQNKVLQTLSNYCGRPVTNYTLDEYPVDYEWTFFHSFWFSFITCSTVGYGNSSPHDQPGQAFLIFYALIGLPVNGFVLAYLGEFFSNTFIGIYKRYKGNKYSRTDDHDDATEKFGLIGKIAMFLVPGIAFFIFLPACLFSYFEDWPYVRSVYYSFVTLTTIGFGDFVPTFQDGQARKFGLYFKFYQAFIVIWNFIGVGYFIMIIGFIAKGMYSKRVAQLEHKLSMNIKETQHRIWAEVNKDVNFLRRILNEANLMKFKPVYTDSTLRNTFNAFPRSSSCPEISTYQNDHIRVSRKRAYSENCGELYDSSTITVTRALSDGELSRIDKQKTFEGSGSMFETNDLLSNVLSALGSIRSVNEDAHSCLELGLHSEMYEQPDGSYEWTWDGNNSHQIDKYVKNRTKKSSITSMFQSVFESTNHSRKMSIQEDSEIQMEPHNRSFISKINPFKERVLSHEERRNSVISQNSNVQKYLENTSAGRESRISNMSQLTCENMELLEKTTIADLIRAVEGVQTRTKVSSETPLLEEYHESSRIKVGTVPTRGIRRGSLRPTHDYTTIFESQNMNRHKNKESALVPKSYPNPPSMPKRTTRRVRSTSSSIPTVQEHNVLNQSFPMLQRTLSLRPIQLSANQQAIPRMPMITVQAPNVSTRNLLWHPEYQDVMTLKNNIKRKRADSR